MKKSSRKFEYRIIDKAGREKILLSDREINLDDGDDAIQLEDILSISSRNHEDVRRNAEYVIAEQAHTAEDMLQFFTKIHEVIGTLTYADNFFIALYDQDQNSITFPYMVDTASEISVHDLAKLPFDMLNNSLTGYMLRTGKMLHANTELMDALEASGEINHLGEKSYEWLGFPLKKGDKILGAFVVQTYDSSVHYDTQDIELLRYVSQHVATALSRKQADEALKESEKKFREVLENSRDLVYKLNLQTQLYEYISESAEFVLGFTVEECQEMQIDMIRKRLHKDDWIAYKSRFNEIISQTVLEEESILSIIEYRWLHKDGEYHFYSDNCTVICNASKEPIAIIGSVRDITELRKSESKLRDTENELQKMQELENIGLLAGGLAHDFNNILTGIFGNIILAKLKMAPEDPGYRYLERTEKSIDRATRLTSQLLTFSKGGDPVKEEVELATLIEETTIFDLAGSNVKPIFDFPEIQLAINVDKGQLQQLISNLVINADQSMPEGGHLFISIEKLELSTDEVGTLNKGNYIKIKIRDQGKGMDKDVQKRIFDPYFSTKKTGSGLGLTTVFSIINKHNGYITFDSEIDKGTTFNIYIPSVDTVVVSPQLADTEKQHPEKIRKILVMDDDKDILSLVRSMLELNSYSVETAIDGKQVINQYQQALDAGESFDAVIMDLTIPGGMGGKEAIKQLIQICPDARCLVSSGYADDPIMANYEEYGFKGSLSKPFTLASLVDALEKIIPENTKKSHQ